MRRVKRRQTVAVDVRRRTFLEAPAIRLLTAAATMGMKYPGQRCRHGFRPIVLKENPLTTTVRFAPPLVIAGYLFLGGQYTLQLLPVILPVSSLSRQRLGIPLSLDFYLL